MLNIARLALALALALLPASFPSASAAAGLADNAQLAARAALIPTRAPSPCSDRAYNLMSGRWTGTLKWSFNASSTPLGLGSAATRDVIKKSFNNIVNARNDCGRADNVSAKHSYLGTTDLKPGVGRAGVCTTADDKNVMGFGRLPEGVLAVTCVRFGGDRIVEADIRINSEIPWALTLAGCISRPLLVAVMTHEVGHAYGLDHVSEGKHGRLTMSTHLDGVCENNEATLGLGDMRGLEALY